MGPSLITGWRAAARAGPHFADRRRAGLVPLPRGEFAIVIAGLGVAAGLDPQLRTLAAAYILIMAASGPSAPRLADSIVAKRRKRMHVREATTPAAIETAA